MRPRVIDPSLSSPPRRASDVTTQQIDRPQPDAKAEATRRRVIWRGFWAGFAQRTGSRVRAMTAKATFAAIREEIGEYESIAWPSVIIEAIDEHTRAEIMQAIDDLVDLDLISLDANQHGMFVDSVVREDDEDDFFNFRDESAAAK
jgi:hypothetical protein